MRFFCCFLALCCLLLPLSVQAEDAPRDTLFQVATIESLLQGVYDTGISSGALLEHGDHGLGTFQDLDGEMVVLDGAVWKVRGDGRVVSMGDLAMTPFACVTFFEQERLLSLEGLQSFDDLAARIEKAVAKAPNTIYALRAKGEFEFVRTRSVDRQQKPYPPLVEAVRNQPEFTFEKRVGTLVGFYVPELLEGLNVPGLHLHFLTRERDGGGHVLDLRAADIDLWLDTTSSFELLMPRGEQFQGVVLDGRTGEELHEVER